MSCNRLRIVPSTAMMLMVAGWVVLGGGKLFAQEGTPLPPTASAKQPAAPSPQPVDRMSRIEEKLRKLEERNQQLQKNYDSLKQEHEKIQSKDKAPVFGADAKNPDGM